MEQPKPKLVGLKNDEEKPVLALIPPKALWEIGRAFTFGQKKYGQFNYMGGLAWTRLLSASMRHILQFIWGEDLDIDPNCAQCQNKEWHKEHSGLPHWACACANLMMMGEQHMRGNKKWDDRYKDDQT
jgi:hypothetical protein